jgi:hypothetical protein
MLALAASHNVVATPIGRVTGQGRLKIGESIEVPAELLMNSYYGSIPEKMNHLT